MRIIPALLLASLAVTPAWSQSFTGPATVQQPLTTNHCLKAQATGSNVLVDSGADCGTSSAVGANPTATAGAAAVNGVSPNFMRADAAPALPIGTSGATIPLLNGNNTFSGTVKMTTLPTADPHVAGQLWNNAGALQVSGG